MIKQNVANLNEPWLIQNVANLNEPGQRSYAECADCKKGWGFTGNGLGRRARVDGLHAVKQHSETVYSDLALCTVCLLHFLKCHAHL